MISFKLLFDTIESNLANDVSKQFIINYSADNDLMNVFCSIDDKHFVITGTPEQIDESFVNVVLEQIQSNISVIPVDSINANQPDKEYKQPSTLVSAGKEINPSKSFNQPIDNVDIHGEVDENTDNEAW